MWGRAFWNFRGQGSGGGEGMGSKIFMPPVVEYGYFLESPFYFSFPSFHALNSNLCLLFQAFNSCSLNYMYFHAAVHNSVISGSGLKDV